MTTLRVQYRTYEFGETDIHVKTLRDRQQFTQTQGDAAEQVGVSPASWPLFGVVWESGEVLARLMHTKNITGLRILEVGCGIGLASLMLSTRNADITATDYNPAAGHFLSENSSLNQLPAINFIRANWVDTHPNLGEFDLIIGSDLLYEISNVELLSSFIQRHTTPQCEILLVDPGRGLQGKFTKKMLSLGYQHNFTQAITSQLSESYNGRLMSYSR